MANSGTDTTTTPAPVADPYLARLMAKAADGGWFRPSALVSMYRLGRIEARRQGITHPTPEGTHPMTTVAPTQVGTAAAHMVLTEGSHYLDVLTHDATQAREYARHELVLPDLSQALTTAAGYQAITGTYRASDTAIRVPGSTGPDGDWQFKPLPYPGM